MNRVILIGRLTDEPKTNSEQVDYDEERSMVARYTLAIGRNKMNNEVKTDFIRIVAFRRSAEFAAKYFHKGMRVAVEGRIQTGSYTNKDGQKVNTFEVVAENQEFADGKRDE